MDTNYYVTINFDDNVNSYDFIHVQDENGSYNPDTKALIIEGNRADGALYIPGGKKPLRITIKGILIEEDYKDITEQIADIKSKISTDYATLTLKHKEGVSWINDWQYLVKRIGEIKFPISSDLRTASQRYEVDFIVLEY